MLAITARDADSFNAIEAALNEFDENGVFLQYFDTAVQFEGDVEGTTVILRNCRKFRKDLNKKKYIVSIPTSLTIDAFEYIKKYETKCSKRVPFYNVVVKGHLTQSEVNFILILVGFNDDSIRILSNDEELPEAGADGMLGGEGTDKNCVAKCPMTNKQMYRMYHPPAPLGHMPHEHDYHCPMPLMNCDEESFIVDTLIDE